MCRLRAYWRSSWRRFLICCLSLVIFTCGSCTAKKIEDDQQYSGIYVWGHEVHEFTPCNQDQTFWVSASAWVVGDLLEHYKADHAEPYQPLYLRFRGGILDEEVDGFASEYDGLIRISEVLEWSATIPTDCSLD